MKTNKEKLLIARRKVILLKRQYRRMLADNILLKNQLHDAIKRIPDYMLPPVVCEMLGHPRRDGYMFCYCKHTCAVASGQQIIKGELIVDGGAWKDGKDSGKVTIAGGAEMKK
jgi:hypothetical protein